jgi:uncharacterized protein DUF4347
MKVWAYHGTKWTFVRNSEYECTPFDGLSDLHRRLKGESWTAIEELCIISHGDKNGCVDLEPPLTYESVDSMRNELVRLRGYLNPGVRVMFFACTAGGGEAGDTLLKTLSSIWAGCEVIGFNTANEVQGPKPGRGAVHVFSSTSTRNDEWSEEAKWAVNGAIIRAPFFEVTRFQDSDPQFRNRCGSDACLGHKARGHRCDPYLRRVWPKWPVSLDEIKRLREAEKHAPPHSLGSGNPHHGRIHIQAPAHPSGPGNFKQPRPVGQPK